MHVHVEVRNDLSKRQTVSPASISSTSGSTVQIVGGHATGWSAQNARLPPVDRSTSQWTTHAEPAFCSLHVSSMCRIGAARQGPAGDGASGKGVLSEWVPPTMCCHNSPRGGDPGQGGMRPP